jgi:hypothetical protein
MVAAVAATTLMATVVLAMEVAVGATRREDVAVEAASNAPDLLWSSANSVAGMVTPSFAASSDLMRRSLALHTRRLLHRSLLPRTESIPIGIWTLALQITSRVTSRS